MLYAHITGCGKYIPDQVVTNDDLAKIMDTSDEWIKTRTGISQRHIVGKDETTASMASVAASMAVANAGLSPEEIDLIIVATITPEYIFPATACIVQNNIGAKNAGAFDLSAGCSGFIYGVDMAVQSVKTGGYRHVLVIGSETFSRFLDWEDRDTCVLFGDGAGAVVVSGSEVPGGIIASVLGADGSGSNFLMVPAGGSSKPTSLETVRDKLHYVKMNGREVYRFATRVMGEATQQVCQKAGLDIGDVKLLIPHQANSRIINYATKTLNMPAERVFLNLDRYGNTSAASIPIALCEAIGEGYLQDDDYLVMVGFGAGLTWGAIVVQWVTPETVRIPC